MNALKQLLFNMADDLLIIGHRNSEWTGIGPVLEEDIAFASMAQDKIGQAQAFYQLIHDQFKTEKPDLLGFNRKENEFYSSHFVEYPIGEYDFSLVRHFLFDQAQFLRVNDLKNSSSENLRSISLKFLPELKYHIMHADIWMAQLANNGNAESHSRLQSSLNELYSIAFGMFENFDEENELIENKVYSGENVLRDNWIKTIDEKCKTFNLKIPKTNSIDKYLGGRKAFHTIHLAPLLKEMTEVFNIEPTAEW